MRTRMTIGGGLVGQGIGLTAVADGAGTSGTTMTPIQRVRFVVSTYLGPNVAYVCILLERTGNKNCHNNTHNKDK